jgi:antitoxin component YwqK of YwqJK toxin-antitoxin module
VDLKKKRYSHKEYHETGNLMEEGTLVYYEEVDNFLKEGTWKVYDENGKQIATQVWSRGQLAEEKKL